ncbi:MAG: branched-chain amino acid aminotransferase [Pseudoxanthomonas sp.]
MLKYTITRNPNPRSPQQRAEILANPGFGKFFSDHMVAIDWRKDGGWHDARVIPYGPLQLDPAASVLHYAQEIFEGIKAYRHADSSIWTFRPDANGARLQRSAQRMALPELPVEDFVEALRQLIAADADWVPGEAETSLYFRPFIIATEAFLGVRAAEGAGFYVIASPVGAYFAKGVAPVSIWVSDYYARAGHGGTGAAKCGGNYAASLLPQKEAYAQGCSQVLFTDAETNTYIDELGGMNVFFVYKDGRIATPELSGSILPGITRDSLITLARENGFDVSERRISLQEVADGVASGEISEMFACGTAAVIAPIAELKGKNLQIGKPDAPAGEVTLALRKQLTDIQYGRAEDKHGWLVKLS